MSSNTNNIQQLYVAYFGRPADATGLAYWETVVAAQGGSTTAVSAAFAASAEYKATYAGLNNDQIVNAIYNNLFHRNAEVAGLTYWSNALTAGTITVDNVVAKVAAGALTTDATALQQKVAGAVAFTLALDTTAEILSYNGTGAVAIAKAWLAGIYDATTEAAAVATAALNATVASLATAISGQTFTLTTGVDTLVGTAANDIFVADNTGTTATSSAADSVDGAGGTNVLKIYSKGAASTLDTLPSISNISSLWINGGEYSTKTLDLTSITGLNSLTIDSPVVAAGIATYKSTGVAVTVNNLASGATVQTVTLAGNTDTAVNLTLKTVSGTANTLDLSGTAAATLNVTSTGGANTLTHLTDTGLKLATINIAGDKAFTATLDGSGYATTGIAAIDAHTATAAVTVTVAAGASATTGANLATAFSYKGGSGNDVLDLNASTVGFVALTAANLNAFTFDAGSGTDTIVLSSAIAPGATAVTTLTGFEVIGDQTAGAGTTVNMANFASATGFKLYGTNAGAVTVNNLASSGSFDYGVASLANNGRVTINAFGDGTADSLALTFGSATAAITTGTGGQTIVGYETVNLTSQGATNVLTGTTTISASAGGAETLNITATKALTLGNLTLSGSSTAVNISGAGAVTLAVTTAGSITDTGSGVLTITGASNVLSIDASSNNAAHSISDTGATSAASIKVGNGANTIVASANGDVITAGTGANTITGGAGADRITVGSHNGTTVAENFKFAAVGDTGTFATPGTNTINTSTFDVYSGVVAGDTVNLFNAALVVTTINTSSDLSTATIANQTVTAIRGTYTDSTHTFVGAAAGADLLVVHDSTAGNGVSYEAAVLTGITSLTSVTAVGLITV